MDDDTLQYYSYSVYLDLYSTRSAPGPRLDRDWVGDERPVHTSFIVSYTMSLFRFL